jgi:hypothetical protein
MAGGMGPNSSDDSARIDILRLYYFAALAVPVRVPCLPRAVEP